MPQNLSGYAENLIGNFMLHKITVTPRQRQYNNKLFDKRGGCIAFEFRDLYIRAGCNKGKRVLLGLT